MKINRLGRSRPDLSFGPSLSVNQISANLCTMRLESDNTAVAETGWIGCWW